MPSPMVPDYDEEQVAFVVNNPSMFSSRVPVVLGTPTINRVVAVMNESDMHNAPIEWQGSSVLAISLKESISYFNSTKVFEKLLVVDNKSFEPCKNYDKIPCGILFRHLCPKDEIKKLHWGLRSTHTAYAKYLLKIEEKRKI